MTEETKIKERNTIYKNLKANEKQKNQIIATEKDLIEKEYKANFKDYMEKELQQLEEKISAQNDLNVATVSEILRCKRAAFGMTKYSPEELNIAFDYYRQFIMKINEKVLFPPTKKNFCGFIGISSSTFDKYKVSDDDRLREITNIIDDYITDSNLILAQTKEIDNITTIFRSKSEHGMVEAQAPIVVEHRANTDTEKIKAQIAAVKHGKSLKTIELFKNNDGSYSAKEE